MLGDLTAGPTILAGPWVRLACERHLRDREETIWTFSVDAADVGIGFYENLLRLPDSLDVNLQPKPFLLEPALTFIVGSLLGWLGPDGYRRFREGYIEMGKGNAKTPLLAGLGLFGLTMDGEAAPEIYAAATTRDQANIMFRDAVRMAEAAHPELAEILKIAGGENPHTISHDLGFFRPFSREQAVKSGPRPHFALIDELHEAATAESTNKLKAGFKFRKQPLAVEITNSGFDRTSICWQHRQHAENVLRGVVKDDRLFAYVCALDEGDDPLTDGSCWIKANPLLGVTITEEYLRRQVENAKNIPAELNTVLRLNFCIWTQAETRAIDMTAWMACAAPPADEELVGALCLGALDLGQTDDFSAWIRSWFLKAGRVVVKAKFWIPQAALEKYPHRPYDQWRRAKLLEVTPGRTTDYDRIEAEVLADCQRDAVRTVAYDKRFAEQLAQHLVAAGVDMVDMPQGFQLNEAIRRKGELIATGELCHGHNEILSWMASNYVVRQGLKGDVRPDKERAGEKIDGQVALDMALALWIRQPVESAAVRVEVLEW